MIALEHLLHAARGQDAPGFHQGGRGAGLAQQLLGVRGDDDDASGLSELCQPLVRLLDETRIAGAETFVE